MSQIMTQARFRFDAIEHCYWLDGKPLIGTTTALGIIQKPLTYWASGMACAEFGWKNPKKSTELECLTAAGEMLTTIKLMTISQYRSLLGKAYRAHASQLGKSATKGIDLHALLEEYILAHMEGRDLLFLDPKIMPFIRWTERNVKRFLFSEACCYSSILHCGGTADFAFEDKEGNFVLGDFKSAAGAYFSMWAQCGAYDLQLSENGGYTKDGEKIFSLTKPFAYYAIFAERAGLDRPFFSKDTVRLRKAFGYAISLYRESLFYSVDDK